MGAVSKIILLKTLFFAQLFCFVIALPLQNNLILYPRAKNILENMEDDMEKMEPKRMIGNIELEAATGDIWKDAWEGTLKESSIFKNITGDIIKAALRVFGWLSLDFALYRGPWAG